MKIRINKRSHYLLSFLYISTTIIFQFVILQIGDSYVHQYQNFVTKGNRQDFKVTDISSNESESLKLHFEKQFAKYEPSHLQTTCFQNSSEEKNNTEVKLCSGSQEGLYQIKDIKAVEGKFPKTIDEVMIERSWNNHLSNQYNVNDSLLVNYMDGSQNKTKEIKISGIYESKTDQAVPVIWGNNEFSYSFDSSERTHDFYFSSLASRQISSQETYAEMVILTYEEAMGAPSITRSDLSEEELSKLREINKKFIENEPKMELYANNESLVNSGNAMRYIGMLVLLPLIMTLVALQYLQTRIHIREYRTLRYLGCNRIQLYAQVWKESLFSAIPAIVSGMLIASIFNVFVGNYILDNLMNNANIEFRIIYTWKTYFMTALLGIIPLFISNTIAMISLRQKYPLQIPFRKQNKRMKSFREVLHFSRISTIFIVCIFSIMLFFYMITMNLLIALPNEKATLKEQISSYEVMPISFEASISDTLVDNLNKLKDVKKIYLADNGLMQQLKYEDKFIPHYVYSPALMDVFLKENNLVMDNQDFIIYAFPNAMKKTSIESGKVIPFQIETMDDDTISTIDITIDRVVSADLVNLDGMGKVKRDVPVLIFSEKSAEKFLGQVNYSNALLDVSNKPTEEFVRKVSMLLGDKDFYHAEHEADFYKGQMKIVTMLLGYFTFVVIFTAMLCFYCVLSCIMMTKQKDLGILRAIGLSRRRLSISMSLEVFYMFILSTILSFIAFLFLFNFLVDMSKVSGIKIEEPSFYTYLWTMMLGIIACMIILFLMINHQSKRQIIVEIKESEGQ